MLLELHEQRVRVSTVRGLSQSFRSTDTVDPSIGPPEGTAFTLIELLVVIAIIAILASLLFSSFQGAKLTAQQAQCLSNLKQVTLSHAMYINDFGSDFSQNPSEPLATRAMNWPYFFTHVYDTGNKRTLVCPSTSTSITVPYAQGTAEKAWAWTPRLPGLSPNASNAPIVGSYTFNNWLFKNQNGEHGLTPALVFMSGNSVQFPSLTPVFADGVVQLTNPNPADLPSRDLYNGLVNAGSGDVHPFGGDMSVITIARHGSRPSSAAPRNFDVTHRLPGMIDVALYDGHVEKSPLENLWNYRWSANWQIPNPRPGRTP